MLTAPIYLDYHSHSLIEPRVLQRMVAAYAAVDANPHSTHKHGGAAHAVVEAARSQVAELLGSRMSEIVFTSGATESNNLALGGLAEHLGNVGKRRIAVSAIEHASILEKAADLRHQGWVIDTIPVAWTGRVDLAALEAMLDDTTGLVSVAWANHEIGVVQPMDEISRIVRARGALLHSDLAQIAGKLPVSTSLLDLASVSAHKLGGPTGVGALHVSRRLRPKLAPLLRGGGQESGARSGTLSPPLCVGFGAACALAREEMAQESVRVARLRDRLRSRLLAITGAVENGDSKSKLPGNLNLRFDGVDGEALVLRLQDEISLSTGSACSAKNLVPSHVLLAIGLSTQQAETAVRIGLGHGTTGEEINIAADAIERAVEALRSTRRRA
ncbi:cysteine desulfurase [Mesorhizobium sp. M1A.F.Ca.ET.072.01.1.1]|uniref:cysteine desulfurase family protein n=1 Tax=Mesorhizobium sp. M1A.F.Ca.ET.072.01.1.1 TaxID=2496753 RepID=UPI000FD2B347|nr:cysteine desulfurase family protein [Mesorhizobium sp. M1A.F.Ca.ET.072.01.1.1]RUW53357.1 cysteine desulfurase [Mesorhizobium sp. M1A.F.Ca.ET.072.01.1.1]TIV04444.1 MAG: aminotransferase class V-fold PLP-dependent enzyme [Mesorhizobium sp.]